jgi:hypothetical protein
MKGRCLKCCYALSFTVSKYAKLVKTAELGRRKYITEKLGL